MQPVSLSLNIQLLHAHKIKHATIAMQPISLSKSMQLLPCIQHQKRGRCHTTNITKLKHPAVAVHTIPNMQVLLLNQYHSAKAVAMLFSQYHSPKACSCYHSHNIKHAAVLCNHYYSAKACSRCHAHTISNMQPLPCNQYH